MRSQLASRLGSQVAGSLALFLILVLGGLLYASVGSLTRDILVTQMLINAMMVVGIQLFIGNTGILSFGHIGFAVIAGYTFVLLAMSTDWKERVLPNAPLGLVDLSLPPLGATLVAVVVTLAVAVMLGFGLVRSRARSGAVAATVITLALLFVVHEVGTVYADLTGGRNGISLSVGVLLEGRTWVYVALFVSILGSRLFKSSRVGRLAQAARDDDLAARAVGIDPAPGQMIALLLSVVIVSVAACLRVFELGTVAPSTFFFDYALLTLVMIIVGGRKSITGSLVGVVLFTAVNELTRYLAGSGLDAGPLGLVFREGLTDLALGAAMVGFMIFRPNGLIEDRELDDWLRARFRTEEPKPAAPGPAPIPAPATLRARDVVVDFGGFRALDGADLEASNGQILGIIGPNGAGKTTLLNVVTGLIRPDDGSVTLMDRSIAGEGSFAIARAGLARTFQTMRPFPSLTVRENVAVAAISARTHRRDHHADGGRPGVDELLVHAGLWELRGRRARELDYGNGRRLELARAAALSPVFMLLDEPTSGMSDTESLAMIDEVRRMAECVGAGVIVIDHDLGFITGICDTITCLDQGAVISTGTPAEIQADHVVQAAYLGMAVEP
jgi:branched-chain amino acid transport system permease protein